MDIYRHIAACNDANLPGERIPVHVGALQVGYLDPKLISGLVRVGAAVHPRGVTLDAAGLAHAARALADAGHYRWRDEAFDVRAVGAPDEAPPLATIDRGALPAFGIGAVGVHLNGIVQHDDGPHLWIARRAADKLLDPGKLDHLVAGGVPAGLTPAQTLRKEAAEEAGLPPSLLHEATHVATIRYATVRPEGLRRDSLHCYDVDLPQSFTPEPRDGEVESFELWPFPQVLERVRDTEDFKFNVNLVLIDLFQRFGLLAPTPESPR